MIIILVLILQVVDIVLLISLKRSGTVVSVRQQHIYVPAPAKHKPQRSKRIPAEESYEEY